MRVIGSFILLFGKKRSHSEEEDDGDYDVEHPEKVDSNKEEKERLKQDLRDYDKDLKSIEKALKLDSKLPENQKHLNAEVSELNKNYSDFFNEDSNNNTRDGLLELKDYIKEDSSSIKQRLRDLHTHEQEHKHEHEHVNKHEHGHKRIKQDSSDILDDKTEPSSIFDLDGGD